MKHQYRTYLQSEEWKIRRKMFIRRAGYKCHICGATNKPLHVHHLTYDHFGEEWDNDCVVLCEDCHKEVHEVVDYAKLNEARYHLYRDYGSWNIFPHMRHANEALILVCAATFAGKTLSYIDRFETVMFELTWDNKCSYIRLQDKNAAIEYVNDLLGKGRVNQADAETTVRKIESAQEGYIFLRKDGGEISFSDVLHWRYNDGEIIAPREDPNLPPRVKCVKAPILSLNAGGKPKPFSISIKKKD